MDTIEIFQVLGIAQTKDQQAIKNAYREKLAVTNPEDNPEGFKRLRRAYEEACAYANREEDDSEEKKDETPSGLWVERAAEIYRDITKRCDLSCWRELFNDDAFLSLEDEENCRRKLLGFLMRHFKLPTDVWKLLDQKLNIVSDAAGLREILPTDFVHYIISRCERGEDLDFGQFEGAPDAPYDLYLQYYDRCWNALQEKQLDQAEECIQSAAELAIFHPVMEVCRASLLMERGQTLEAVCLMKELLGRYPLDPMVSYNTAECLWSCGRRGEAAQIYKDLKEQNDSHYMANLRLTELYYGEGEYDKAKKCAEKVLRAGADDDFMELLAKVNHEIEKGLEESYQKEKDVFSGLELGWCYLQDGRVSRGIRIAEELCGRVPKERDSEHKGLLTKLYVEETDYEQALSMAEEWIEALTLRLGEDKSEEEKERDQDRIRQYHVIRMQAWRAQGDMESKEPGERRALYERAIEEARGLLTDSMQDIGLLLEMAQIYLEMKEYEQCLELTGRLIDEYQVYAAYATELEVYRRQRSASGVIQAGRACIRHYPGYIPAYERMARVFLDLKQTGQLRELLAEAEANHVESVILEAYRYQMTHKSFTAEVLEKKLKLFRSTYSYSTGNVSMEKYREGLPILTEYLYRFPSSYMLMERGRFHRAAGQYEAAKADFEKVLADDPCHPYVLDNLSFVYKYLGDYERALIYLKRAFRYRDEGFSDFIYQDMANLYSLLGNYEKALEYTRKYAEHGDYLGACNPGYLVECMALCGDLDGAVRMTATVMDDKPFRRFEVTVDLYQRSGNREKAGELIAAWKEELDFLIKSGKAGDGLLSVHESYRRWCSRRAWQDLLFGDGGQALKYYALALRSGKDMSEGTRQTYLSNAVFVCILCGNEKMGRKYAAGLKSDKDSFLDRKLQVCREFFSLYYSGTEEELDEILDRGEKAEMCRLCSKCVCRDLEAGRLLLMFRRGQISEAAERLKKNLERLPMDKYLLAIWNICVRNQTKIAVPGESNGIVSRLKNLLGRGM